MKKKEIMKLHLHMFDGNLNTNVTADSGMTAEMKTYYDKNLIKNAEPELVHDQFGQKRPIPKNGGKTIEFRKYDPFPKALTPLTEGVTPDGRKMSVSTVTATVKQYGDYTTLSDVLLLTAIDNNLVEATTLLGSQAGRTLDTITREVLASGTNVLYAGGKSDRKSLTTTDILTMKDIKNAVRILKDKNTSRINGDFVAIIHPDTTMDIMNDEGWIDAAQYAGSERIFKGEIGKMYGVRFVESTEAKIFAAYDDTSGDDDTPLCYGTLVMGANAYGVTEIAGGGLTTIIKQLGSGGTADPLNQRATAGWKAIKTAEILTQEFMVRIEHSCSHPSAAN